MLDINKHQSDDMLSEWVERRDSGQAGPLDRANAALLRADQAAAIIPTAPKALVDRVALATSACGLAMRKGEPHVALAFAEVAEREAVTLDSYDSARLDGLQRASAFSA